MFFLESKVSRFYGEYVEAIVTERGTNPRSAGVPSPGGGGLLPRPCTMKIGLLEWMLVQYFSLNWLYLCRKFLYEVYKYIFLYVDAASVCCAQLR